MTLVSRFQWQQIAKFGRLDGGRIVDKTTRHHVYTKSCVDALIPRNALQPRHPTNAIISSWPIHRSQRSLLAASVKHHQQELPPRTSLARHQAHSLLQAVSSDPPPIHLHQVEAASSAVHLRLVEGLACLAADLQLADPHHSAVQLVEAEEMVEVAVCFLELRRLPQAAFRLVSPRIQQIPRVAAYSALPLHHPKHHSLQLQLHPHPPHFSLHRASPMNLPIPRARPPNPSLALRIPREALVCSATCLQTLQPLHLPVNLQALCLELPRLLLDHLLQAV